MEHATWRNVPRSAGPVGPVGGGHDTYPQRLRAEGSSHPLRRARRRRPSLRAIVLLVVGPLESRVDRSLLRLVWLAVAVGATLAAGMVRARLSSDFSAQRAHAAAVVVWGLAEGQALLGLVGYLLTGDSLLVALPLALFGYLYLRYPPGAFRGPDRG